MSTVVINPFGHVPETPFLPSDLANLWGWWRNNTGLFTDTGMTTPAAPGNSVAAWADQSGNSRNMLQSTAGSRPLMTDGGVETVSDDVLITGGTMNTNQSMTWAALVKTNTFATSPAGGGVIGSSTGSGRPAMSINDTHVEIRQSSVVHASAAHSMVTGTYYRVIATWDDITSGYAFYVNGVNIGSGTGSGSVAGLVVQAIGRAAVSSYTGVIKEGMIYGGSAHSGADITSLDSYLASV